MISGSFFFHFFLFVDRLVMLNKKFLYWIFAFSRRGLKSSRIGGRRGGVKNSRTSGV